MTAGDAEHQGWRTLLRHTGDGRNLLIGGFAVIVLDATAGVLSPAVFRDVLNRVSTDPQAFLDGGWRPPAATAVVLALTFLTCAYLGHTWTRRGAARWAANLRTLLFEHVQRLSADFFTRARVGDVASRIGQDIERLELAVWQGLAAWWAAWLLVLAVALIAWVDLAMGALAFVLLAVGALWTRVALPRLRRQTRQVRDGLGTTAGRLTELLSVNPTIKAFSAEDLVAEDVRRDTTEVREVSESHARTHHRYADLLSTYFGFVAPFILLFVGAWRVARGTLSVGDIVGIWGFWLRAATALTQITTMVPEVLAGLSGADRAAELLGQQPTVVDQPGAPVLEVADGTIDVEGVSFRYPGDGPQVLDDLQLHIPGGTRVAVVGPSGAGKSTLVQLLLRFYDPDAGRVTIDGHDLRRVQQRSVRDAIGVVLQDNVLLAGTIADNLRLARPDATDEQLEAALAAAEALDFVQELDGGIDATVGDRGVTLSGGQRQRLAIARVLLKDPHIVVLDESTSALDAETEQAVLRALDRLLEGRTAIVIAHRLATVRDADEIVVLEHGRVSARGSHEALLERSATYRRYHQTQAVA